MTSQQCHIRRVMSEHRRHIFKSVYDSKSSAFRSLGKVTMNLPVSYRIPCSCGKVYYEEMRRRLDQNDAGKKGELRKSCHR